MQSVDATHTSEINPTDIFGFTSSETIAVILDLSNRAYHLLIEEIPEARPYINLYEINSKKPYRFIYEARNLIGIGRFILGLPGEIIVQSPPQLIDYLQKRIREFSFAEVATDSK